MWLLHRARHIANIRRQFLSSFRLSFCANSEKTNGTHFYFHCNNGKVAAGKKARHWLQIF